MLLSFNEGISPFPKKDFLIRIRLEKEETIVTTFQINQITTTAECSAFELYKSIDHVSTASLSRFPFLVHLVYPSNLSTLCHVFHFWFPLPTFSFSLLPFVLPSFPILILLISFFISNKFQMHLSL